MVQPFPRPVTALRHGRFPALNRAELIGGVLHASRDPEAAAEILYEALRGTVPISEALQEHQLEPALVAIAEHELASEDDVEKLRWCRAGAAWVLGRRSAPTSSQMWEPVVTYPPSLRLPMGTERATGETLVTVIRAARSVIRIVSPFVDREAIDYLSGAITGAASRGAATSLVLTRSERSVAAARYADERFRTLVPQPMIRFASEHTLWPHLKVVTVDGSSAYVGSANFTGAALAGRNLELGVLVRGSGVALIDNVLDLIALEPQESR